MKAILVDDNFQMLQFMEQALDWPSLGIQLIGVCDDGNQALTLALSNPPDLLITDIDMPRLNGLELIEKLKQLNEDLQALIISCHDDFTYAQRAVRLVVCDYLLKDTLEPEQFQQAVIALKDRWQATQRDHDSVTSFYHNLDNGMKNLSHLPPQADIDIYEQIEPDFPYIVRLLMRENKKQIFQEVTSWVAHIQKQQYDCRTVKTWAFYILERIEHRAEQASEVSLRSLGELSLLIDQCSHINELQEVIVRRLMSVTQYLTSFHPSQKEEIREAKLYVDEHIHEKIQMETVAKTLYLNPSYFSRLFKKETNLTFIEYVHQKKVDAASTLLMESNQRIDDVSREFGFENTSYFIKLFKRFKNMSPNEYRRSVTIQTE